MKTVMKQVTKKNFKAALAKANAVRQEIIAEVCEKNQDIFEVKKLTMIGNPELAFVWIIYSDLKSQLDKL